jgi:hypothetical protein
MAISYSELGRVEEALSAAHCASDIFRRLAKQNPIVSEPDVAHCLGTLGRICLRGNPRQASNYFRQGINTLRQLFLDHPNVFAGLMTVLQQGYLARRLQVIWPGTGLHTAGPDCQSTPRTVAVPSAGAWCSALHNPRERE